MRTYVIVTGIVFALITLTHVWLMATKNPGSISDPVFLISTAVSAGLAIWSFLALRGTRPAGRL